LRPLELYNIKFTDLILEKIPLLKLGIALAFQVEVNRNSKLVTQKFQELDTFIKQKFENTPPSADTTVSAVRRMYRRIGWEPTRYRPSSEAMIRRIIKDIGLYNINNLVDLGNIVSTYFHLPMGLYDSEKIIGTINIDVGKEGEAYQGISKDLIHATGKMVLRDEVGVFGNPTADSKRTSLSGGTKNVLAIFFTPPEIENTYINKTLDFFSELYSLECNRAEIWCKIVTAA
jgi:DNA/RNA-binding domain of Phe-tRNA-synthetase-like protein